MSNAANAPMMVLVETQFTRAIRKDVPTALSRCFAANFAHKPALPSSLDKQVAPCASTKPPAYQVTSELLKYITQLCELF